MEHNIGWQVTCVETCQITYLSSCIYCTDAKESDQNWRVRILDLDYCGEPKWRNLNFPLKKYLCDSCHCQNWQLLYNVDIGKKSRSISAFFLSFVMLLNAIATSRNANPDEWLNDIYTYVCNVPNNLGL